MESKINGGLFTSGNNEWETPPEVMALCRYRWGPFDLDPAATAANAKAPKFYTQQEDGLVQPWTGRIWLNPPYGRQIGAWVQRCYQATVNGEAKIAVALLPARTDTQWWHYWVMDEASEVHLIRGRVYFVGATNAAPFPSAIVVWRGWRMATSWYSLTLPRRA